MRAICDCIRATRKTDGDGDVVCATCRRLLKVGPLGINGRGFAGVASYSRPSFDADTRYMRSDEGYGLNDAE
jgi:hypothetical protein